MRTGIMRSFVILAVVALAALSYGSPTHSDNESGHWDFDIIDEIHGQGYPAQNLTAKTSDGYLLDIIRIPGSQQERDQWENSDKKKTGKIAVVIMHGLLGSADEFVVGGQTRGLAYKLADRGFDVFMGNARGSKYGRRHNYLNPERDAAFWKFNWDQVGLLDLPAIIDSITEISGQTKVNFIGYNQGNTAFFVMASRRRDYNSRIKKMIALGPMVYMQHAHHPLMSRVRANINSEQWIQKHLGKNEFNPSPSLINEFKPDCISKNIDNQVCDNIYFLVNGYSQYFNQSIVPDLRADRPYGISVRQLLHYAQTINTDGFESYNQADDEADSSSSSSDSDESQQYSAQPQGDSYDLSAVTVHTYLLYVPSDAWSSRQDVNKLTNSLPNVKETYPFSEYSSNVDFILAKNAYSKVHDKILNILQ